jgi:16S rRNA processing protein RimM
MAGLVEVVVGKVGRAHGLRGDVSINVRTDEPDRRFAVDTVFATARGPLTITRSTWHGQRLLVQFAQAGDRAAAEALLGTELLVEVPADERPDDPEEFYDHQLRGLTAYVVDGGEPIGQVSDVLHLPGQDMLVLDVQGGEVLVPFAADIVTSVDLAARRVEIADRPGLLTEPPPTDGEPS